MNVSKYARYKARYVFVTEKIFPELLRSRLFAEDDQLTNLWMIELLANERPVEVNNPANFRVETGSGPLKSHKFGANEQGL